MATTGIDKAAFASARVLRVANGAPGLVEELKNRPNAT